MTDLKKYPVLRFLRGITALIWNVGLVVAALMFVAGVLVLVTNESENFDFVNIAYPVNIKHMSVPVSAMDTDFYDAEISVESGRLSFLSSDGRFKAILIFVMLSSLSFALFMIYQMRMVFKSFAEREPFDLEIIGRMRLIGFLFIGGEFFVGAMFALVNLYIKGVFQLVEGDIIIGFEGDTYSMFAGLVILVFAEIFKYGAELKEETKLTI